MGWLGEWIGAWGGEWLGYEAGQQQPEATPYTRYGRVLNPLSDRLFAFQEGSWQCSISSGAVILARTDADDYVRFRVPDTDCPSLPEPSQPLDSGNADEAEPNRWQYSGNTSYQGTGWQFGPLENYALNYVQPAYLCYSGDFETEITLVWSTAPPGGLQGQIGGVAADFDRFIFGLPDYNSGIELGTYGEKDTGTNLWWLWVSPISNGVRGAYIGTLVEGQTTTFRICRTGTTVYVQYGINSVQVATGVSGMVQLKLWRDYTIQGEFGEHIPRVTVTKWETLSGAPDFISVTTPVVDMGQARRVVVRGLPSTAQLVWRAGNDLPLPDYWDNPTGEYRYWQAKLQTSSSGVLLERVEFVSDAEPMTLWRRFRSYWQMFQTGRGRLTKGPFRTVFGGGGQMRTTEGWQQQSDEERNVGDW